jgi:hypothetical protein
MRINPMSPLSLLSLYNPLNLDLLQVIDEGGLMLLNVTYKGVVQLLPVNAPPGPTPPPSPVPSPVDTELGLAGKYELLAAAGISNTGNTVITGGNIGSFPTPSITGFPPGVVTPPFTIDNTDAAAAQGAALVAYNFYSALTFTSLSASSANLATLGNGSTASTYTPGNYSAGSSMDIPTSITLDAQGNAAAMFVFKAGSTLTLESGASVLLVNGAQASNVVWLVGSSYTSVFNGTSSVMNGNILANTSITLGGGTLNGRALAGIVTTSGAITIAAAMNATVPTFVPPPGPAPSPAPGTGFFTSQCLFGKYYTRVKATTVPPLTAAMIFADVFSENDAQQDIMDIIGQGDSPVYHIDYLGVAFYDSPLIPIKTSEGVATQI